MRSSISRTAAPLRQEILSALRAAIVAGEFAPQERLVEPALCERFDVSRSVIREVLRQLESEGLITMIANRGAEVAVLTRHDAEALYEVRGALEALAARLFATRATTEQREALLTSWEALSNALGSDDPALQAQLKDEYYERLLAGAQNDEISKMVRLITARTQMMRTLSLQADGRAAETLVELERLTRAAAIERDPEQAGRFSEEHVRNAAVTALAQMAVDSR